VFEIAGPGVEKTFSVEVDSFDTDGSMSFPIFYAKVRELAATAQAMGAVGAELRLRQSGIDGDPRVRKALQAVANKFGPDLIDGLAPAQIDTVVGQLTYALQEALDLIREPAREPGWTYEDPTVLQQRGRGSRAGARNFETIARRRPAFAAVLEGNCRFLDVGTGTGWLAIECAKIWPRMQIVGIDIWEPALKLAKSNISDEGLEKRITLREQDVGDLSEDRAFNFIWVASMFLPITIIDSVIARVVQALIPGGFVVFGMFAAAPGPYGEAVRNLLTVRSGGYPWQPEEIGDRLRSAGLQDVEFVDSASTTCVMIGRR
jgi:2-polyprenyl-3-methyl-5-hydroxy-6-metoxy-1,4-benzoquinol methylase